MSAATPQASRRSRFGLVLAGGQVRYQLLLLLRSPMGTFTALVIPLMVLVALDVATPQVTLLELHGIRYADFLTPAMVTFGVLNACYVNTITSVVIAREEGILKRLHGTPLPLWAYVLGRIAAGAVVAYSSMLVVLAVAALFMHVHLSVARVSGLVAVESLAIATFTALGLAVSTVVPRPDTALPVAYGTILPLAFVSDLFFPATTAPSWLNDVAAAFPLRPIAAAAERAFAPGGGGWPMTGGELLVVLAWTAGAMVVIGIGFRWQPGTMPLRR